MLRWNHMVSLVFSKSTLLELRMWYQINIIRARMDVKASTSANDGLRKRKAWFTISGWKDKRGTRVFVQSTNEKLGAVLVVNNEHDVAFMIIGIDDQSQRQKYRWSTINGPPHEPTNLIPLSKIRLWQQLYFHDHLFHMWACHYCNCAFGNDLGLIYLKQ